MTFRTVLEAIRPDEPEPAGFRDELIETSPAMVRVAALLALAAFAGMSLVDPLVVSGDELTRVYLVRLASCSIFIIVAMLSLLRGWMRRWARPVSIALAAVAGLTVAALALLTGGSKSDYHQAMLVVFFGFAVLPVPWRPLDAPLVFGSSIVAYDALLAGVGHLDPSLFWTHNAVLWAGFLVAIVLQRVISRQRLVNYLARQALASANERLKSLDAAKSHFFSNISHELRTPLTLIVAPLEALLESSREPLSAGQRERLQLAQRNALRLLRLVDDLLALTKAEAASLKLHVRRLDLGDLARSFIQDVAELAARKHITVAVHVPEHPVYIEGDITLIERVLLNVFGNAAKFVAVGGHIELRVEERDGGVEVAISDNGVGIAEHHLPNIFDRFYQGDAGTTRSTGGTGIGLSLVKEITELHGGHVRVESVLGQGTTMRCWFPPNLPASAEGRVVRAPEPGAEPQGLPEWHQAIRTAKSYRFQGIDDATERRVAPRPRPRGDAPTILIVEDNPDMIRFLVALLAYEYNVLSAQNGRDGLRMALERMPDLIISDVMMPEMDGFEMVRRIRDNEHGARIPLIFLTARGSSDDRIQGHAAGSDTYLAKPFRSEELLAAVDALLTRQKNVLDSASSREDEALVYMATGIQERLASAVADLRELQGAIAKLSNVSSQGPTPDTQVVPGGASASIAGGFDPLPRLASSLATVTALVGSLRELSEAGTRPVLAPVDIDDAIRGLVARLDDRVRDGRALHLELQAREVVSLTEDEVRAIVEPLLHRALAVTPVGRNVYLQTQRKKGGQREESGVTLVIRDEGPTLSADQAERLFFPFTGLEGGLEGACGLELARARRIALTRAGVISVEPEGELGSRVVIHLPVVTPRSKEAAA